MGKKSGMPEGIKTTMYWVLGIGIIALIGLIMLILFGNLSGNYGFTDDSDTVYNVTSALGPALINISDLTNRLNPTVSNFIITNATGGETVPVTNYTLVGAYFNASGGGYHNQSIDGVNLSFVITYDSQPQVDADNLIVNYTRSVVNTGRQFPTVGTIVGVALLLIILLGVLVFAIKKMMNITEGGGASMGRGKTKRFGGDNSAGIA